MNNETDNMRDAAKEVVKKVKKTSFVKKIKSQKSLGIMLAAGLILCIAIVFSAFKILPMYLKADSVGSNIGRQVGDAVGYAVGTFNGVTNGKKAGAEAGKIEGQSAKDTSAKIVGEIKNLNRLEVMVAGIKINNDHMEGQSVYKSLSVVKGNAVFSVAFDDVSLELSEDLSTAKVTVPDVSVDLYIDNSSTKIIAEYQKNKFAGTASDGFTDYINSANETSEKAEDVIENYDVLRAAARESAKKTISSLVCSINRKISKVDVEFFKEAGRS